MAEAPGWFREVTEDGTAGYQLQIANGGLSYVISNN